MILSFPTGRAWTSPEGNARHREELQPLPWVLLGALIWCAVCWWGLAWAVGLI